MNKLERLLRGDKATFDGETINHVADLRHFDTDDNMMIAISFRNVCRHLVNNHEGLGWEKVEFVEPEKQRTIEDGLKEGDIITDDVNERLVLGIAGKAILASAPDRFNVSGISFTLHELVEQGYKLKVKDAPSKLKKKMTVSEIEKVLGEKVEIISEQ